MYVYRRLSNVRRVVFWLATALYLVTFPIIILDVTGIVLRPAQPNAFVQTGALEVVTRPDGCEVVVDGRSARSLTPAVVEGLQPGRHDVSIQGPAGASWRGSVEVAAGEVTSVKGLPVGLPSVTRVPLAAGPVLAARRSLVSASVLLAGSEEPRLALLDLAAARLVPLRGGPMRGTVSAVNPLLSDAEFLVQVDLGGDSSAMLLDQSALGGWSSIELPFGLPPGVLPLAGSWRDRAVLFLDGQRVVQRSPAGDRTVFVTTAPVVASGAAQGGMLLLDRNGWLYHQARFLAPRVVSNYQMGSLAGLAGGARGRIVAQKGSVLVVQGGQSLFLLTRTRAVEVTGVGGACFDEVRERIIVWSANRVGRLDSPWIESETHQAGQAAKEPTLSWILQTEGPVERVVPVRDGDAVLIVTDGALLLGVLSERVLLEPFSIAALSPGGLRPVVDPSGAVVLADAPGQAQLLRLAPPPLALPGEQR
jgi:hypothetical protein